MSTATTSKAPKAPKAPAPKTPTLDFTIDRDALRELVDAARTVAKSGHMPITTYVRFAWTHDTLTASATDLMVSYRASRPCVSRTPGEVCIPAAFFAGVIASMPRGDLAVSVDPVTLRVAVKSKGARAASAIGGMATQDFPTIRTVADLSGTVVKIPCTLLADVLATVAHAMSADDQVTHLHAVFLDVTPECVRAVATDGNRMAISDRPYGGETSARVTIPKQFLDRVRQHLAVEGNAALTIGRPVDSIGLVMPDGSEWITAGVERPFPSYQQVIPTKWAGAATVSRAALLEAVRACGITEGVLLTCRETSLGIETQGTADARVEDSVDAVVSGDLPPLVAVGAAHLAQALSALSCESVDVRLSQDLDPVLVAPAREDGTDDADRFVIMPRRPIAGGK